MAETSSSTTLSLVFENDNIITYEDILNGGYNLSEEQLFNEVRNILTYKPKLRPGGKEDDFVFNFIGSKFIQNFHIDTFMKTKRKGKNSFYEAFLDKKWCDKIIKDFLKRHEKDLKEGGRFHKDFMNGTMKNNKTIMKAIYKSFDINRGCVIIFTLQNSVINYLKYKATKVLDPTAGWGGRLLGAINLGIEYTGFDTNINLKEGYDRMLDILLKDKPTEEKKKYKMIYQSCLDYDFSTLDYDFVFTSPPYENIELYEGMSEFSSESNDYYEDFLIPLIFNCCKYNKGKYNCFNISPQMYKKLTKSYGFRESDEVTPLHEQKSNNSSHTRTKLKDCDYIYIWYSGV